MKLWVIALTYFLLTGTVHAQSDAIPRDQLTAVGPGRASSDFPITTAITSVVFNLNGMEVEFGKKNGPGRWPDGITPGWDGPLQYSIGFVVKVNDWWYASAPIENWNIRKGSTGPLQDQSVTNPQNPRCMGQFQCNIFYDGRWDPLQTRRPAPGETIGVYVVSGDARNEAYYGVLERSNIVVVQLPGPGQTAVFDFTGMPAPVPPAPAPVPAPAPSPVPPAPSPQLPPVVVTPPPDALSAQVLALVQQIAVTQEQQILLERDTNTKTTAVAAQVKTFGEQFGAVMVFVGKYIAPAVAAWFGGKAMAQ